MRQSETESESNTNRSPCETISQSAKKRSDPVEDKIGSNLKKISVMEADLSSDQLLGTLNSKKLFEKKEEEQSSEEAEEYIYLPAKNH